eukprot:7749309-Ditylum_brightwellii.AAC.1
MDAYTTRVKDAAQEFDGTNINRATKDIGQRWHLVLGHGFEEFKKMCHFNQRVPPSWEEDQELFVLAPRAEQYLQIEKIPKIQPENTNRECTTQCISIIQHQGGNPPGVQDMPPQQQPPGRNQPSPTKQPSP